MYFTSLFVFKYLYLSLSYCVQVMALGCREYAEICCDDNADDGGRQMWLCSCLEVSFICLFHF